MAEVLMGADLARLVQTLAGRRVAFLSFLVDASGSMDQHAAKVVKAFQLQHEALRKLPNAADALVSVYDFSNVLRGPAKFRLFREFEVALEDYRPMGNTALYRSALCVIEEQLRAYEYAQKIGMQVSGSLVVFTDGFDNLSSEEERLQLHRLAKRATARGFRLMLIGIGVPGDAIANMMGFPPEHAETVEGGHRGIDQSMHRSTVFTVGTLSGVVVPRSTPVTPHTPT